MFRRKLITILRNFGRAGEVIHCMKFTHQWLILTLMYLGLKECCPPFLCRTRTGKVIELNTFADVITVWVIFCRHEYSVPKGTKVVIDAGANIGVFSIYASLKNVDKIYAIEPFPETMLRLKINIDRNNLGSIVQTIELALAGDTGTRNMVLRGVGYSQSAALLSIDNPTGTQVKVSTLADFLTQIDCGEVDMLKLDIEGAEYEVFQSSSVETLRKIKSIFIEYHPSSSSIQNLASKERLFEKILSSGFELIRDSPFSINHGTAYFKRM